MRSYAQCGAIYDVSETAYVLWPLLLGGALVVIGLLLATLPVGAVGYALRNIKAPRKVRGVLHVMWDFRGRILLLRLPRFSRGAIMNSARVNPAGLVDFGFSKSWVSARKAA